MRGDTKNPGNIFWGEGSFYYRLPALGECSGNQSVSVCQLALVWEAAFGFCDFFLKTLSICLPFHDGWFIRTPAHTTLSGSYLSNVTQVTFFFCFPNGKSPQRELICWYGRCETKNGRSAKRHQNQQFKNCSEQWKNILIDVLHQMKSILKVTEV